ncbi:MAG TPA: signal peptidase II [Candidatus Acidoferrales bacterium]|nr:signal peptidase II [Candidatus Acidoferrales bacterium]
MKKYLFVLSVAAVVVLLDQATKWYIRHTVSLYESIAVIDSLFHITYVRNSGGAFGLLAGSSQALRLPFFLLVSLIAVVVLLFFVRRVEPGHRWLLFALGAILGGALGNLVDRMASGAVTDFLDFHWHGYHWPAFNVADSCITTGMVILLLYSLLVHDEAAERPRA